MSQYNGVIVESDRDRLEYGYILTYRGEEALKYAIKQLAGNRKPYISNIAKILNIQIPKDLPDPDKILSEEKSLEYIEQMKKMLSD